MNNLLGVLDSPKSNVGKFNETLLELFSVIPRKMNKVSDMIIDFSSGTLFDNRKIIQAANAIIAREQDSLDAMRGQVNNNAVSADVENEGKTILEAHGIELSVVDKNEPAYGKILSLMGRDSSMLTNAYKVKHLENREKYESFKKQTAKTPEMKKNELLWHGSRTQNWWNILGSGKLLLNPGNVVRTGSMFGHGLYFANKFAKSFGYTSCDGSYWVHGGENTGYLALFEVLVGRQMIVEEHGSWCYSLDEKTVKAKGFDSVFAKAGVSLRNDELIVYDNNRCDIRYLVEVTARKK
ncbi:MAG: Poly(ADP-ribose) polymerase catalytic domain protein [Bacteroidetes bacterium ADurb.BinA174]|nr:MAG: Poly(ADP-ribose) polymerase catalytic domain protein [Bacteroidetes bacterium ADurb.BinA174]